MAKPGQVKSAERAATKVVREQRPPKRSDPPCPCQRHLGESLPLLLALAVVLFILDRIVRARKRKKDHK